MRCWLILILVVLTVVSVFAAPALASAESGEAKQEAKHEAKAEGGLFDVALDLGIYTIVVFLILLFILGKFAWGPMLEGLKRREENILAAIEDARKAREESEQMRRKLEAELAKAHEEQRRIVEEAHKAAQRVAEEMMAKARAENAAERERLRREIQLAQDEALTKLHHQVSSLAVELASKVILRQLPADDHRRLVDDALKEMQAAAGNGHKG